MRRSTPSGHVNTNKNNALPAVTKLTTHSLASIYELRDQRVRESMDNREMMRSGLTNVEPVPHKLYCTQSVLVNSLMTHRPSSAEMAVKLRRRASDARWRANIAACFQIMRSIIPAPVLQTNRRVSKTMTLHQIVRHLNFLEELIQIILQEMAERTPPGEVPLRMGDIKDLFINQLSQSDDGLMQEEYFGPVLDQSMAKFHARLQPIDGATSSTRKNGRSKKSCPSFYDHVIQLVTTRRHELYQTLSDDVCTVDLWKQTTPESLEIVTAFQSKQMDADNRTSKSESCEYDTTVQTRPQRTCPNNRYHSTAVRRLVMEQSNEQSKEKTKKQNPVEVKTEVEETSDCEELLCLEELDHKFDDECESSDDDDDFRTVYKPTYKRRRVQLSPEENKAPKCRKKLERYFNEAEESRNCSQKSAIDDLSSGDYSIPSQEDQGPDSFTSLWRAHLGDVPMLELHQLEDHKQYQQYKQHQQMDGAGQFWDLDLATPRVADKLSPLSGSDKHAREMSILRRCLEE